jgi:hypothetical protein
MRHFANGSAESYSVGVVDVARWEQYELGEMPREASVATAAASGGGLP